MSSNTGTRDASVCHTRKIDYFGETATGIEHPGHVDSLFFAGKGTGRRIAVLPDIYGLTDFYKGYASFVARLGAETFLTNPWSAFGELDEPTREAAYERRRKLKDREHCDLLEDFLAAEKIDAIVGFCIGGNFAFEMARRGFEGTIVAVYPLPWGMANQDEIAPAFSYMPTLGKDVTILMGEADHLAGPDNIELIKRISADNAHLVLHLYSGSNHGFFTDIDGSDEQLTANAKDAIDKVTGILF